MRESEQYGTARDRAFSAALSEGWAWLMTHGLVVPDAPQSSAAAYQVSRLGEQPLRHGLARLAAAEKLGVTTLHPRIKAQDSYSYGEPQSSRAASPVGGEMVKGSKLVLVGGLGIDPQGVDAGVGAGLGDGEPAEP
jgi:hypothetical protein